MGRQTPFTKVPTGDSEIDRLQDRLVEALRVLRQSPQALVTQKGSLLASTGAGAPAEHRASTTDGLPLVTRSSATTGLAYEAVSLTGAVSGVLPIANGGTGSATQNFVDLVTSQSVAGQKFFTDALETDQAGTGANANTAFAVKYAGTGTGANNQVIVLPNAANSSYNTAVSANDIAEIGIGGGGVGTGVLTLTAWSNSPVGIRIKGDGTVGVFGSLVLTRTVLTYSATIATDASLGNIFSITANNGVAFTISNPTNLVTGQRVLYTIRNTSGGALGAITWGGTFKMAAWVSPATANSRSTEFVYDGTNLVQLWQSAADVPN